MADRGYINLLSHLSHPSTSLPLQSLTASISHHLSSKIIQTPTPLSAIIISSPFFAPPFSHPKLLAQFTAFRHAVHLKHKALVDDQTTAALGTFFSSGIKVSLRDWVEDVLKGL